MKVDNTEWFPQSGDIVRLKGTEKPLYQLCDKDLNNTFFNFVEVGENGIAGGIIYIFELLKDYELVKKYVDIENFLKEEIIDKILPN